jgi:hypothetical protein
MIVVLKRSCSKTSGRISCDVQTKTSGASSSTIAFIRASWSPFT